MTGRAQETGNGDDRRLRRDFNRFATDIPEIKSIEYIMHFGRAAYLQEKPGVVERLVRALAKATKLMQEDTAVARDAFFAQMSAKAFGGISTEVGGAAMRTSGVPISPLPCRSRTEGMKGARTFFQMPDNLSNETLIDNSIARRVDGATAK